MSGPIIDLYLMTRRRVGKKPYDDDDDDDAIGRLSKHNKLHHLMAFKSNTQRGA